MRLSAHIRTTFAVLAASIFVLFIFLVPGGKASAVHVASLTINPNPVPYGQSTTISYGCSDDWGSLTRNSPSPQTVTFGNWGSHVTIPFTSDQSYTIYCIDEGTFWDDETWYTFPISVSYTCPAGTSGTAPNCTCNNGTTNPPTCNACPGGMTFNGSTCGYPPSAPTNMAYSCNAAGTVATISWSPSAGATVYGPRIMPSAGYSNSTPCTDMGWAYNGAGGCYHDNWGTTNFSWPVTPNTSFVAWVHAGSSYGWGAQGTLNFSCVVTTPVVSISASGSPTEPSTPGTYTISRTGSTASSQPVGFSVNTGTGAPTRCTASTIGSCSTTTDYYLTGSGSAGECQVASGAAVNLTIPASRSSCTVTLIPVDNTTAESNEPATMTLNTSGGGYTLGTSAATLTIADNDSAGGGGTTLSIQATDATAAEPSSAGEFTITRTGSTASAITVNYTLGSGPTQCLTSSYSSCSTSSDYHISGCSVVRSTSSGSFTIGAGNTSCALTVTAVDNTTAESTETVTMTIAAPSGYTLGTSNASINITDNDSAGGGTFDFAISVPDKTVTQGTADAVVMQARRITGSGNVYPALVFGLPTGVTYSFNPSSCAPASTSFSDCSTINLTVGSTATLGNHTIDVYAQNEDGTVFRTDSFVLTVQNSGGAGTFAFSILGQDITIAPGDSDTNTLYAKLDSGSATQIGSFTPVGAPSGVIISTSPSSCTPSSAGWAYCSTMTITVGSSVTPGTYLITLQATGGSTSAMTGFGLTVGSGGSPVGGLTVSIAAQDSSAGEPLTGQEEGVFILSRAGDPDNNSNALLVMYTITSDATEGSALPADYALGGTCQSVGMTSAVIPEGEASCTITVTPFDDTEQEPTEPILITIEEIVIND